MTLGNTLLFSVGGIHPVFQQDGSLSHTHTREGWLSISKEDPSQCWRLWSAAVWPPLWLSWFLISSTRSPQKSLHHQSGPHTTVGKFLLCLSLTKVWSLATILFKGLGVSKYVLHQEQLLQSTAVTCLPWPDQNRNTALSLLKAFFFFLRGSLWNDQAVIKILYTIFPHIRLKATKRLSDNRGIIRVTG